MACYSHPFRLAEVNSAVKELDDVAADIELVVPGPNVLAVDVAHEFHLLAIRTRVDLVLEVICLDGHAGGARAASARLPRVQVVRDRREAEEVVAGPRYGGVIVAVHNENVGTVLVLGSSSIASSEPLRVARLQHVRATHGGDGLEEIARSASERL